MPGSKRDVINAACIRKRQKKTIPIAQLCVAEDWLIPFPLSQNRCIIAIMEDAHNRLLIGLTRVIGSVIRCTDEYYE